MISRLKLLALYSQPMHGTNLRWTHLGWVSTDREKCCGLAVTAVPSAQGVGVNALGAFSASTVSRGGGGEAGITVE